jgi:hypothetical protein
MAVVAPVCGGSSIIIDPAARSTTVEENPNESGYLVLRGLGQ